MRVGQVLPEQGDIDPAPAQATTQRQRTIARYAGNGGIGSAIDRILGRQQPDLAGRHVIVEADVRELAGPLRQRVLTGGRDGPGWTWQPVVLADDGYYGGTATDRTAAHSLGVARVRIGGLERQRKALDGAILYVDVATAALCRAQIGDELLAAAGQINVLLNGLPVDVEQAGVDLQPVIEEGELVAELIAPQAVRPEVDRRSGQADGLFLGDAGDTQPAIDAAFPVTLRCARVEHHIRGRLIGEHGTRSHRGRGCRTGG